MTRRSVFSGTSWEDQVGYARAVAIHGQIAVSGTTAVDETGQVVGPGDPYLQTAFIFDKIFRALAELGAGPEDVLRTRMFVTNIEQWAEIARAHREKLGPVRPAATMVEITRLIDPRLLVEIEVDAVLPTASP
ncbi:MAG: RidA family protein [Candidatus Hydrogenedentes bacterium]|nr:RidA family protein [Candidatus Hydrogenedentota bacterium]